MPANSSHSFKTVQQLEEILLRERRSRVDQKVIDREADTSATDHRPGRLDKLDDTTGLTLSGGGTRSAAFCLGILQSLYEHEVLNCFDYLSTVSGGGYIGSYYTSWMSTLKTRETVLWKPGQKTKSCVHLPPPAIACDGPEQRQQAGTLATLGSQMLQPFAYLSRHLPGWLLTTWLVITGLLSATSLIALFIRTIDHPLAIQYLAPLGFAPDPFRAFLPSFLSFIVLLASILVTAIAQRFGRRIRFMNSTFYVLFLASITVGGVSLLSTDNVDISIISDTLGLRTSTQDKLQTLLRYLSGALLSVLTVSILPALNPRKLLESGQAKSSPLRQRIFNIATAALIFGVPLLSVGIISRENISGYNDQRPYPWELIPYNVRDWGAFADQLLYQTDTNTRPSKPQDARFIMAEILTEAIGKHAESWNDFPAPESLRLQLDSNFVNDNSSSGMNKTARQKAIGRLLLEEFMQQHRRRKLRYTLVGYATNHFWHIAYLCGVGEHFAAALHDERRYRESTKFIIRAINLEVLKEPRIFLKLNQPPSHISSVQKTESLWQKNVRILTGIMVPSSKIWSAEEIRKRQAATVLLPTVNRDVSDIQIAAGSRLLEGREAQVSSIQKANWELVMMTFSEHFHEPTPDQAYLAETDQFFSAREVFAYIVQERDQNTRTQIFWTSTILFAAGGFLFTMNPLLLQGFYRDTLSSIWLAPHGLPASTLLLKDLNTVAHGGPFHIINCAVSTFDSDVTSAKSQTGSFTFTSAYVGGKLLGYRETEDYCGGNVSIAEAMALSGAAVSPVAAGSILTRVAMIALNMRLGRWLPHPSRPPGDLAFPSLFRLAWEWITKAPRDRAFQFITDGGHNENLAIAALLQRRCRFILACDAGLDPNFTFEDLLNLQSESAGKFGIEWELWPGKKDMHRNPENPDASLPETLSALKMQGQLNSGPSLQPYTGCAKKSVQIFKLKYPSVGEEPAFTGILVYVKLTVPSDAPWDLQEFMKADAVFPHDSTADQFFDASRFLRYVALGKHCGNEAVREVYNGLHPENCSGDGLSTDDNFAEFCGPLISGNNRWKVKGNH